MYIGVLTVRLLVRDSRSLKDKRQVARSILDRLKSSFNISAMEVDHLDDHRQITLGFSLVGMESETVAHTLDSLRNALRGHPVAEFLGSEGGVMNSEEWPDLH
jgi:hypothetical protein